MKLEIKCKNCRLTSTFEARYHLRSTGNCGNCLKWNYDKLMTVVSEIHRNKYTYDISKTEIITKNSHIHVKCNSCKYNFYPTIHNHVHRTGCPKCSGQILWKNNKDKFTELSFIVHGTNYNYDDVHEKDLVNRYSKINVFCIKCKETFCCRIHDHINGGSGCPTCKSSKGEQRCMDYMNQKNIIFKPQFILSSLSNRRFDFMFYYNDEMVFIEYDGIQHFGFDDFFHENNDEFLEKQVIDVIKTKAAMGAGKIIRIDYTQINSVGYHIEKGLESNEKFYCSNPDLYDYIIKEL